MTSRLISQDQVGAGGIVKGKPVGSGATASASPLGSTQTGGGGQVPGQEANAQSLPGPGQAVNTMPSGFVDEDPFGGGYANVTRGDGPTRSEYGYGFRQKQPGTPDDGYDPITGTPPPVDEPPEIIDPTPFTDENPYDDDGGSPYQAPSFTAGGTNRGSFGGVQNAGITGYTGSDQQRMAVANQLGYQQGQGDLSGLAGFVGTVAGIPGASFLADQIPSKPTDPVTVTREDGSTYTDARDRSYGSVGTTDARGNVFSEDGVAYDPVTGQRVQGVFRDRATATPHIKASLGFAPEGYEAPPQTAAEAGLMSIAGNDSISRVLDDATIASTPEIGRASVQREINADRKAAGQSYTHTDNDGNEHHVPAGRSAVTDSQGNAVTDNSGTVVTSTNYGGGNDDNDSGGGGGK